MISLTCIDDKAAFEYFLQLLEEFIRRDKSQDIDPNPDQTIVALKSCLKDGKRSRVG